MTAKSAAVCKRGHLISVSVVDAANRLVMETGATVAGLSVWSPDVPMSPRPRPGATEVPRFCGDCAAPVITACGECGRPIPAPDLLAGVYEANVFCEGCGQPFPWASREQRIGALLNLLDFEDALTQADRLEVIEAIAVLSVPDEPEEHQRQIAAGETIKRLAPKAWRAAQPVLIVTLPVLVQKALGVN